MYKLIAAGTFAIFAFGAWALPPCPPPDIVAKVIQVIDGNTILVRITKIAERHQAYLQVGAQERVRYIGVDAPELEEAGGRLATELNRLLVDGRLVFLELDSEIRDTYNRLLAYVYLDPEGNFMINLALIATPFIGTRAYPGTVRYADIFEYIDKMPLPCPPQVIISRVLPNPRGEEPFEEWIELKNNGIATVDISGWKLTDEEGEYTIPRDTILKPGETLRIYGRQYNPAGTLRGFFLANAGDCVLLFDAAGRLIDRCCWQRDPGTDRPVICH